MINEIPKNGVTVANDYEYDFYFSLNLSEIIVKTCIHKLIVSFIASDFDHLNDELKRYNRVSADHYLKHGSFKRKRVYERKNKKIDLIYKPRSNNAFMSNQALFVIYQPTIDLMNRVNSIFEILSINPTLSTIELAWDFYSPFTFPLYEFLKRHLFLRYQRSPSRFYKDTYYTNNLRKSSKGVRVYLRPKDTDFKKFVRLELELHRAKIRNLNLTFPLTADQLDVDFRNYFSFMRFDWKRIYNCETKNCRSQFLKMNLKNPQGAQILHSYIDGWIGKLTDIPLMRAVEILKSKDHGIKNYSRFLIPMNALNLLVEAAAYKQRFGLS